MRTKQSLACASGLTMTLVACLACGCSTARPLYNGQDLSGWVEVGSDGAWSVTDEGALACSGEHSGYAWLSTSETYADFELTLEWRISPYGNSGIFLRVPDRDCRASQMGLEIQIRDDGPEERFSEVSGSVFSRIPASGRYAKAVGQWNRYRILMNDRRLRVVLNGFVCFDEDIDLIHPDEEWRMDRIPASGFIGLQNHGDPVEFRNIMIRPIE